MAEDVEEIDGDEGEQMLERVGAIDVAKASGKVCVRLPGQQRRTTRVWDVSATTNAIMGPADELAELRVQRVVLEEIDALSDKIDQLTSRVDELIGTLPAAQAPLDAETGEVGGLPVVDRLDEVPGIGPRAAQVIVAEIGLDMTQFPSASHLVSWAKLSPRTIQSGPRTRAGRTGKGNPYLKGVLGEIASAAARTDTFLGERYRRLLRRRGRQRALVAVARSILVVVWHLLNDPTARFVDLGSDFYDRRANKDRRTRDLVRQLMALGHQVTLAPAA